MSALLSSFRDVGKPASGFTSSERAIEAPRGFAHVTSTKFDPAVITEELGTRYELLNNMYKPYACGLVVHAAIDGCIEICREHGLKPDAIETIELTVSPLVTRLTGPALPAELRPVLQHALWEPPTSGAPRATPEPADPATPELSVR